MTKPFKTYDEQLQILESRGMLFDNRDDAKRFLETESYYNIINGYKDPFIIAGTDNFLPKTSFEYIKRLYLFDKRLRHSCLVALLEIETMLKSIIAYEFAAAYGECAYLDIANFNTYNHKTREKSNKLISHLNTIIKKCYDNEDFSNDNIRHYIDNHGEVPIWVLFSHITLTELSKFYECLLPNSKKAICEHIQALYPYPISPDELYVYFRILTNIRNLCAHNLRLYNYRTVYEISPKNYWFAKFRTTYGQDLKCNNIIALLIILNHLGNRKLYIKFIQDFISELEALLDIPPEFAVSLNRHQNYSLFTMARIIIDSSKAIINT